MVGPCGLANSSHTILAIPGWLGRNKFSELLLFRLLKAFNAPPSQFKGVVKVEGFGTAEISAMC
jgi:hypothetical protein